MFEMLLLSVKNLVKDNDGAKLNLLQQKTLTPILVFLTNAMESLNEEPQYNEDIVISAIDLLSNAVEMFPQSQEWIIKNVKIYEIVAKMMFYTQSLPIAGRTCLFLSHLMANNKAAQLCFMTDEMAKSMVYLLNFNELMNQCDIDTTMETL